MRGKPTSRKVDVFAFDDPREYLKSVLKEGPSRRLSGLAEDAGFGSLSLLSMILSGKRRLSPWAAERLAKALALRGRRRSYFLAMERSLNGRSQEERVEARERMLELKSAASPGELKLEQYRFLATWFYPVLYVMAGMRETKWDPAWLASRLGRNVSVAQVVLALSDLEKLGILERTADGVYRRLVESPRTAEDVRSLAVYRYHRQMIEQSLLALTLPLEVRELNGLTAAVPKRLLPELKARLRAFRKELNDFLETYEDESEEVYQFNLHLYPLTRSEGD